MTFTATEKTLEMEENTSEPRERASFGLKLITEIEDRLVRCESTLGINLDGMANIPPGLLSIVHLKKAQEEHRKQDAEFEVTWNAKLVHHLETTRTEDWQMLLSRLEFQHAMDDVFQENEDLLVQVRVREAEAGAELETLKARSLHILRRKPDGSGYEDVCCVLDSKTGQYVDFAHTAITDAQEVTQLKDAVARFASARPEETVTNWQHVSATLQHLDRLHGLEKDSDAANCAIGNAVGSVQTSEGRIAALEDAQASHAKLTARFNAVDDADASPSTVGTPLASTSQAKTNHDLLTHFLGAKGLPPTQTLNVPLGLSSPGAVVPAP